MYNVSDDMVNMTLKQMGAVSVKSSPGHINKIKFEIGPDFKLTYIYESKENEGIYLQRIEPYPMMIGKLYNELDIVAYIERDYKKFLSAYNSSNFPKFIALTNRFSSFNRKVETLFMTKNVPGEGLDRLDSELEKLNEILDDIENSSPNL